MPVYNLPELTNDHLPAAGETGGWTRIDDLGALASDLKIDKQALRLDAIKSIPDAWAHIQLFGQALADPGHEAHASVLAQWRGLLALIALQPFYAKQYALTVAPFALQGSKDGNRLFRDTMARLAPAATLSPDTMWERSGLLRVHPVGPGGGFGNGIPVAFLSPLSLVAAGRAAGAAGGVAVPWLTNEGIVDPLRCSGISADAFKALQTYLGGLLVQLADLPTGERFRSERDRLVEALRDYTRECEKPAEGALALRPRRLDIAWPQPLFEHLGETFDVDEKSIAAGASDCRLRLRRLDGKAGLLVQSIVLVDPLLGQSLGRDPASIRVWERYTLADAMQPEILAEIRQLAAVAAHMVVTPDDLLTDRLVRLSDGSTIRAHKGATAGFLLPLTPLALLLGDATALADAASLTQIDGAHVFTLQLVVEGARDREHPLRRSYPPASLAEFRGPDDLAIWPDFERPGWSWNFLRFQYDPKLDLRIRFGTSAAMIAAHVRASCSDARAKEHKLKVWGANALRIERDISEGLVSQLDGVTRDGMIDPEPIFRRFQFARKLDLIGEQHHLPLGIEAIFFGLAEGGVEQAAGCALVVRSPVGGNERTATVSVDFGSTNTITYALIGEQPEQLNFSGRLHRPVKLPDEESRTAVQSASYTDFFPPAAHTSPFPTILKVRERQGSVGDVSAGDSGADALGLRYMIFFNPMRSGQPSSGVMKWLQNEILVPDIKWSRKAAARQQTVQFLRQTMVMSAAEMVGVGIRLENIRWRLSYPQSFDNPTYANFKRAVADASVGIVPPGTEPVFKTEGEAAAHFFTRSTASQSTSRLLVMLDIGGSTTDVAFRLDGRLVWRGSIKIAGRAFFTNYLTANPALLDSVDEAVGATLRESFGTRAPPASVVELLLGSSSFTKRLDDAHVYAADEPAWTGLRHSITVAVGGMLFYLGLTLRGLMEKSLVDGLDEAALQDVLVAFGGRGSHSLRHFQNDGRLKDLLQLLLFGAGLDPTTAQVKHRFSPQPKHEVASGLLDPRQDGKDDSSSYLPLGEPLDYRSVPDGTFDAFSDVADLPPSNSTLVGYEPVQLLRFLDGLKTLTNVSVRLDKGKDGPGGASAIIRRNTDQAVREARNLADGESGTEETFSVQPPFLLALSNLVDLLADSAAVRASKLAVSG